MLRRNREERLLFPLAFQIPVFALGIYFSVFLSRIIYPRQ